MRKLILCVPLVVFAACGGDGGSTQVTVQQPPGTTVCNTSVDEETGAAVNVFCDASGNVVGSGPVTVNSNNPNTPTTNNNSGNNNDSHNVTQ